MSETILAIKVSDTDYDVLTSVMKEYNFKWLNDASYFPYPGIAQCIVIKLHADKRLSWSNEDTFERYYSNLISVIEYDDNFSSVIYPRFKELLLQSTIVKPKLTKKDLEDKKIWIGDNPELHRQLQDKLYDLGFKWATSDKYAHLDSKFITTGIDNIYYGNCKEYYNTSSEKEVLISDILDKKEPMKEYKVTEEFIKEAYKAACLTWKSKLQEQFPGVFLKTYKAGNVFVDKNNPSLEVTIIRSNNELMLLCTGKAFKNELYNGIKVTVNDWTAITEEELKKLFSFSYNDFKLKE
jgi:hypothetical protein